MIRLMKWWLLKADRYSFDDDWYSVYLFNYLLSVILMTIRFCWWNWLFDDTLLMILESYCCDDQYWYIIHWCYSPIILHSWYSIRNRGGLLIFYSVTDRRYIIIDILIPMAIIHWREKYSYSMMMMQTIRGDILLMFWPYDYSVIFIGILFIVDDGVFCRYWYDYCSFPFIGGIVPYIVRWLLLFYSVLIQPFRRKFDRPTNRPFRREGDRDLRKVTDGSDSHSDTAGRQTVDRPTTGIRPFWKADLPFYHHRLTRPQTDRNLTEWENWHSTVHWRNSWPFDDLFVSDDDLVRLMFPFWYCSILGIHSSFLMMEVFDTSTFVPLLLSPFYWY